MNRSDGTDALIDRIRISPTPFHWKPHFYSTRREAGFVTRAPARSAAWFSTVNA